MSSNFFERVWAVVACIPKGKVANYGQIAAMLGNPRAARTVGWALHSMPDDLNLPWHRVINAEGRISTGGRQHEVDIQRMLLETEGVEFNLHGGVDLAKYQWRPDVNNDLEF